MDSSGAVFKTSSAGVIDVPDAYMPELRSSNAARNGIIGTSRSFSFGTRAGRRCEPCNRTWNAWTAECHTCHNPTT